MSGLHPFERPLLCSPVEQQTKLETVSLSWHCQTFNLSTVSPLPAPLFKELLQILSPSLLNINTSLSNDMVPSAYKTTVIKPPLK